ncbi:PKD-like domain-containing protein, partial [Flavobacterium aquidurense]|uniref:beta strand repeat-containing protein n=1 Tax=Flavobacterium aquidurense TaxID=362413 RepID=UPI002854399C
MIQKLLFCTLFFIISFFSYGQSPQTFNSSGNFVVPPGVTSLTVEVWGAGGAGGGSTGGDSSAGGGGGGGAYTKNTSVPVLANASIPFIVGTGGIGGTTGNGGNGLSSSFLTVSAGGGFGGRGSVNGGTGGARGTGGTNGGNGADGNTYGPVALSGGGGGSAGSGGAGGNASDATGGNAGNIDGSAGAGGVLGGRIFGTSFGDNGSNGTSPGSGGSGGAGNNYVGGNGGNGQIRISWNCPVYTLTSPTTASSSCGSGKSTVRLTSTTLPNGTYNVTYSTTNPNSSGNTASMTFNAGTGTFLSKTLSATSTITVNSIEIGTAPSTCSFNVTSNNTATATVNTLPGAPTISASGPLTFCAGGSVTLTSSVATNNLWSTGATTPSITVSATGTYTVRAINTTTLCQSLPSAGTTVTVTPKPVINAMGTSACSGALFTAAPVDGTNGTVPATTTYTWTAPTAVTGLSGGIAGSGATITGTLTNSTNAALSTTYSVTPVTAGCTGTPFNLTVTVNPKPAINAMGTSACSGALFTATPANSTNGVVPATTTYTWTAPTAVTGLSGGVAGSGATITGTLTNSTNAALSTTYSVTPITAGCTGTPFNLTVTVNPTPAINAMGTSACSGALFTATPANSTNGVVPATTTYTWTAPTVVTGLYGGVAGSGATITGTLTNSTNAALSTIYSVTPVTAGCTGTPFNLTVTVNPTPAINAMGTSACSGALFTATPANSTNGVVPATTTYTWTAPTVVTGLSGGVAGSGATITGTLTNSTNAALSTTYSVTPVTAGCTGTAFNLTVTVNPTPAINAMATSACSGTLFTAAPANTTNGVVPATTT